MFSYCAFGFYLVLVGKDNRIFVVKRVAATAWGLFELSGSDLLRLRQAAEDRLPMPTLSSLQCLYIGSTRKECLHGSGVFQQT